jgi:hypothetical protein
MLEAGKEVRPSDLLSHKWPYERRFANLRGEKRAYSYQALMPRRCDCSRTGRFPGMHRKSDWRKGLQLFREEAEKSSFSEALARASVGEAKPSLTSTISRYPKADDRGGGILLLRNRHPSGLGISREHVCQ